MAACRPATPSSACCWPCFALGPDESYLLVNETLGYRTLRPNE